MAPVPDLTVRDVVIKDAPFFTPGGTIQVQKQVSFFAGAHGPFILHFPQTATGAEIKAAIDHQVVEVRRALGIT